MTSRLTLAVVGAALLAGSARGAEITDVATGFEPKNRFDFRFRLHYEHTEKRAQIKRELEGLTPDQQTIRTLKDLLFSERRDVLALRTEFSIYRDLELVIELPLVLGEQRRYAYDQSAGGGCVFAPAPNPNCVNALNSSTVADGIVPAAGFDAGRNGVPTTGSTLFNGVNRGRGSATLDTLNLAVNWAALSQRRDPTKPTWVLGFEAQISVGTIKRLDRAQADANRGVSEGIHRFIFRTAISKRIGVFDPYFSFWYLLPSARGDSLFVDYGRAQAIQGPQHHAGTTFGLEIIPLEREHKQYRLSIDLRGRIDGHFNGRGYSEAWEMLAGSPALACDPAYNPSCDPAVTKNAYQGAPYSGLTAIDSYASYGADIGVVGQVGPYFRARLGFDYTHDQSHLITNDDIGVPNGITGRVSDAPDFNPAWRQVIDQVGRRYRVDNVNSYRVSLWAQVMF